MINNTSEIYIDITNTSTKTEPYEARINVKPSKNNIKLRMPGSMCLTAALMNLKAIINKKGIIMNET